jgi:hypothetical protein
MESQNPSSEEVQQMITNLKFQVEESKRIDEACKSQLEEKQFLEARNSSTKKGSREERKYFD